MRADVLVLTAAEVHHTADSIRWDKDLDDVPGPFLSASARHLRAASYSAVMAARRLEQLAEQREHAEQVRIAQLLQLDQEGN